MGNNFSEYTFNVGHGYLEGLLRGFRSGILDRTDYLNLVQCETIEDLKMQLAATDYGNFLQSEPSPIPVTVLDEKLKNHLVVQFRYIRAHSVAPLSTFLDYITYSYMIDNIILLITGTLHQRQISELRAKCHPLGSFEEMESINIATTPAELYSAVLVDTPIGPYFKNCITETDLNELNIEIIRNALYKAYLEDFYKFCQSLGGDTAEVMQTLLAFEADRRAFIITINSFGTELTQDDREKLYPTCGKLYPDGLTRLARCEDYEGVKGVADSYLEYANIFNGAGTNPGEKSLEDKFFEREVHLNIQSFMYQFHFGIFYSYMKLMEQESRNIVWISECISQRQRSKIDNYIPIF